MKTNQQVLQFLSFVAILMATGCSKERSEFDPLSDHQADAYKMHRMLTDFRNVLKTPLKDGQTMTIDSAIWYMEASMNETYARASDNAEQFQMDSSTAVLPVTEQNELLVADVAVAYNALIDSLAQFYYSVPGERKVELLVLSLTSAASDSIIVQLTEYVSTDTMPNSGSNWTFGSTDYWRWGLGMDKCSTSVFTGLDASTQLTLYANNALPAAGSTYYFSSLSLSTWVYPEDVASSSPNPFGYFPNMLFYNMGSAFPEPSECLSPNAMNYYLYNLKQIAQMPQYKPNGKSIARYNCCFDYMLSTNGWGHLHRAQFTYGFPNVAIDPPEEP